MRLLFFFPVMIFTLLGAAVEAAESVIHTVQPPAWIERAERALPARAGSPLRPGDLLRTGDGGHAEVQLPAGARMTLAANTAFRPARLAERNEGQGEFFDISVEVLGGSFRLTTEPVPGEKGTLTMRVGALIAVVNDSDGDILGRSGPDEDFIVLQQGRVEVFTEGMAPEILTDSLDGRRVIAGETQLQSMRTVTPERVRQLESEAGLDQQRGSLAVDGELQLVLASSRYPRGIEKIQSRLESAGYPAYIEAVPVDGVMWYRVVIDNVASVNDGKQLGRALVRQYGVKDSWLRPM